MTEATTGPEGSEPADRPENETARSVVAIAVTVTRTGGFAGLRRTWHAQPDSDEVPRWIALIDTCPWDAADPTRDIAPTGADRFVWRVDARCGDAEREAALADPEVQGPWRELIDAVRAATATSTGKGPGTNTRRDGGR
ncbi:protealysin inhibitor emfourin [Microbacterium sp.]|uniref:protealysin inhibitor emfourin n=1 Tax=Microbacterium sp. TaxID=51671 RepID=UPI002E3690F0|nr:protealysin inhibitor emfourin [Microbacterium sp.]HEX5727951.1 protealysin inhibitor emfourin [Microbacterium sp.]